MSVSKMDVCIQYLQRICLFPYPDPLDREQIPCTAVYKFAITILRELEHSTTFSNTSAESLSSVAAILSFNFITDIWIASEDVAAIMCICPRGSRCRWFRCRKECTRSCNCSDFAQSIGELKVRILRHHIGWNLFGLYIRKEVDMHFIPALPGRPFDVELDGMHALI